MDVNVQVRILSTGPPNTGDDFDEDADQLRSKGLCQISPYSLARGYP